MSELKGALPDLLNVPVAPVFLVPEIAERIRQAVINGTLRPGGEINESQLSERLGVSRGTLREAVRTLISEGLLVKQPNRTAIVRELSAERIWEIMTLRAAIESFAARVLAQRLTPAKIETLELAWEALDAAAEAGDGAAFARLDFQLHEKIVELSEHELLYDTWSKMSAWVRLMFAARTNSAADLLRNSSSHRKFIDAILSGDAELAEAQLKADLLDQEELARFTGLAGLLSGANPHMQPDRDAQDADAKSAD